MADSDKISQTSKRPYLIRAMHEWMSDNGQTPHIVVDAAAEGVNVPSQHVKDGRIVLNVSYTAAHSLSMDNQRISFRARFSGSPFDVMAPVASILGIYARETGQGMIFSEADEDDPGPITGGEPPSQQSGNEKVKSHLKEVK